MRESEGRRGQTAAHDDRLSRMSEASVRINESLDLDEVLRGVVDSARSLTDARYGLITTSNDAGQVQDYVVSGLRAEEAERLWAMEGGLEFFEYLRTLPAPLRVADFAGHARSVGLPEFREPAPISSFLAVPIRHRGASVGNLHVAKWQQGEEFSHQDEQILVMFASQVALVVANARRHRDERRARADLETLIDISPVGVAVCDAATGAVVSYNREAGRIVEGLLDSDQAPEQLLGSLAVRRGDGRELSLQEFPLAEVLATGETVRAEEMVIEVPDGRSVAVLVNATPVRSGDGGEVESVMVTLQDMTPLEETQRMRAEFLAMVSHELRTPLTSIRGSATTMLDVSTDLDPAELRQFLRIIVEQSDTMRELIGDLLDAARIQTGTLPVSPEPAAVTALVDRARSVFTSAGGNHRLRMDLAPDLPMVMADRRRIVQVVCNLLSNAAAHSPESSTITLAATHSGSQVEVSVTDEGAGIPAGRMPYLFGTFPCCDDPRGNTGLGLAICKGIVEAHGGRIWADSGGPGLGARFAFTIPATDHAPVELRLTEPDPPPQPAAGPPVLVVDDDPQTLRYIRRALSAAGYNATVTADPAEALDLVQAHPPRLVLVDLVLPGADGIELLRDILAFAEVPVIVVSAYGRDRDIARAFESGAADYIVKPFSPTELVARVNAALRRTHHPHLPDPPEPYVAGDLTIDYRQRLVTVAGRPVTLTATEYRLLFELSVNAGTVLTHDQLLRRAWDPNRPGNLNALRAHLTRLRRKLGDDTTEHALIVAEPRVGYRMPQTDPHTPKQP